jgi:tyrosyl-tRNA synthetase
MYIPFLRDVGRHFSVNRMLAMESVKARLEREQNLSFLEFNYSLLQAYDFLELHRRHGALLQMGGSDQWANILAGADLIRRVTGETAHVLTTPLITTASGAKMGKTAAGAVWINPDRLDAFGYWQFWRNTEDADVGRFLRLFTDLEEAEVARLAALGGAEVNEAKKVLATEATALLHGRPAADQAAETARRTFESGETAETLPTITFAENEPAFAVVARAFGLPSNAEARRNIRAGGVRLADAPITDEARPFTAADAAARLSLGRKRHVRVMPG